MASCAFAVNKQKSLEIIRGILATQPDTDTDSAFDIPLYYHKLAVVELSLKKNDEENDNEKIINDKSQIETFYDRLIAHSYVDKSDNFSDFAGGFNCAPDIDIAELEIKNDKINLNDVYLHGTRYECDWSALSFTFNEHLQTWINGINDEGNGINDEGVVFILDFREYFEGNVLSSWEKIDN